MGCCRDLYPISISPIGSNLGAHISSRKLGPIDIEAFVALLGHSKQGLKLDYVLSRDRFPQQELGNKIHWKGTFLIPIGMLPWLVSHQHFSHRIKFRSSYFIQEVDSHRCWTICHFVRRFKARIKTGLCFIPGQISSRKAWKQDSLNGNIPHSYWYAALTCVPTTFLP